MEQIRGKVRAGKQFGAKLGFPTANVDLRKEIPEGIYLSRTKVKGIWYNSLTFIGAARTFGRTKVLAETFLLDFSDTIYNQIITINLLQKIRDNMTFQTTDDLIEQIEKDEEVARAYFAQAATRDSEQQKVL